MADQVDNQGLPDQALEPEEGKEPAEAQEGTVRVDTEGMGPEAGQPVEEAG